VDRKHSAAFGQGFPKEPKKKLQVYVLLFFPLLARTASDAAKRENFFTTARLVKKGGFLYERAPAVHQPRRHKG
jgi:hypothetical protein